MRQQYKQQVTVVRDDNGGRNLHKTDQSAGEGE